MQGRRSCRVWYEPTGPVPPRPTTPFDTQTHVLSCVEEAVVSVGAASSGNSLWANRRIQGAEFRARYISELSKSVLEILLDQ